MALPIPVEIERKFLLSAKPPLRGLKGTPIVQGYLTEKGATVRVRIAGEDAFLTIKGKAKGLAKPEFEYPIPVIHAKAMLATLCKDRLIEKTRYVVPHKGQAFEVDVFKGRLSGLVLAELELESEAQSVVLPDWVGLEVSHDRRFANRQLALLGKIPTLN